MGITFRQDVAAVPHPSNASTRKYGQSLVLQQQQQKYAAQQAGYDRLFQVGRDNMQNRFQADRDRRQNEFQLGRDKQQNDFILGRDKAQSQQQQQEQRAKDFADARSRMDAYAKDALSNPEIPHEVRQKIQNLLSAKMVALAPNQYTPEAQQEFLDQYNAQLAGILSEIPPPKPKAPAQPNFHTDQNGNQWVESGPGKWEQVPKQAQQPMTAQDYYNNPDNADKFQKDLDATMGAMQDAYDLDPSKPKPTPQLAWEQMQKDYQFRMQALGRNAQAGLPPAGQPFQLPSDRMAPAMGTVDPMTGQPVQSGAYGTIPQPATTQPSTGAAMVPSAPNYGSSSPSSGATTLRGTGMSDLLYRSTNPDGSQKGPSQPTGQRDARGNVIMDDGSVVDPRDTYALRSSGATTAPESAGSGASQAAMRQQVKVGGKPLAVTPGTLTPQETAARQQIMELPQEQRIAALMPYDPELKGKTLEQLLEDPETKAGYDEMSKQGLTTGNYRKDMLTHLDEMLQHNVLRGAGKSLPEAYVGMRADEITDPKAKAEVTKLPRPKSKNDRSAIRSGQLYVDPEGVIRARS